MVDQREIQRLGGVAARYPVSYIVYTLLSRHGLYHSILDVTYGRGRFYAYRKPEFLVGADVKVWDWVVSPTIFIKRPVWALRPVLEKIKVEYDVLVVDPPQWKPGVHYHKRGEYKYILGDAKLIIHSALRLAETLGIKYILLHYDKLLNQVSWRIRENIEYKYYARYQHNKENTTYFTLYEAKT